MKRIFVLGTVGFLLVLALGACSRNRDTEGIATDNAGALAVETEPTFAPIPTFTPTPEPPTTEPPLAATAVVETPVVAPAASDDPEPETATETVTDTELADTDPADTELTEAEADPEVDLNVLLAPTPTPEPGPLAIVTADAINIRGGPGTAYAQVGVAAQGDQFVIAGRNPQGDWWQVCCMGEGSDPGWIYGPLVEASNAENIAVAADIPPPPVVETVVEPVAEPQAEPEAEPVALPVEPQPEPPAAEPAEPAPAAAPPGEPAPHSGTAGNFDPNAQYQIVHTHTRGFDDNNGGIFNKGGQQIIFLTVLDEGGNGIDGVVVKNAVADNLTVVTGDKGPGKAEIKMDWDPYKLFVAQDGSGPVTSHVSNQMNNPYPHIPDVVGRLGPVDNEYAICPTAEDRCSPPFYHAHWSYDITFQKVR